MIPFLLLAQLLGPAARPPYLAPQIMTYVSPSGNTTVDLFGPADSRPGPWGHAADASWAIVFNPPAGQQVRIYRLMGDFSGMPTHPTPVPIVPNALAGVLMAFATTAPDGSVNCPIYCADNTKMYRQVFIADGQTFNSPFDYDYFNYGGFLLEADNTLTLKVATFLNTIGLVHMEPTYTITYRFEPIQ